MNCSHHPVCPGCPLMGRSYSSQLKTKRQRLQTALSFFPHLPKAPEVIGALHTEAYRHRLKLPLRVKGADVRIGLRSKKGELLNTPDCPVLADGIREVMPTLLKWLRGKDGVHSLDVRLSAARGGLQVVLACKGGELHGGARSARALMRDAPAIRSVAVSRADPLGRRVMGSRPKVIAGSHALEESIGETRYRLHPGAFFQVDPRNALVLHEMVTELAGKAQTVLDLYAGVGAYALMLAPGRRRVLAIEEVPQAADGARRMAPKHVEVIASRVEDAKLVGSFDLVILNPARRGADIETLRRLPLLAKRVIYISCGPETLARDLDILASFGMRVKEIRAIDLFPQTPEVETIVLLERGEGIPRWPIEGGKAQSPWLGVPSGVVGWANVAQVLVLGRTANSGPLPGGRFERIGLFAGHSLLRITLNGHLGKALDALAKHGHPVAGDDPKTARFFAEKAGLLRPFIHVETVKKASAPLHGDLALVLKALSQPLPEKAKVRRLGPKKHRHSKRRRR